MIVMADTTLSTSILPKENYRLKLKGQRKREITTLLRLVGSMEARLIADAMDDISEQTTYRYLGELLAEGFINKVRLEGKSKNISAYSFQSDYGAKGDMLSHALCHPLHRLALCLAGKIESHS